MIEQIQNGKSRVYPIVYREKYGNLSSVNCYLYDNGNSLSLIDAGLKKTNFIEFFNETLRQLQLSITDIDQILLTHHHDDHTGLINEVLSIKDIPVYAHHKALPRIHFDESYLQNKITFFKRIYEEYGCLEIVSERFKTMEQTYDNREQLRIQTTALPLHNGDEIEGMKVMEVPGHSPDSILFYDQSVRWQFSGDLVLKNASTNALIDFDDDMQLLPTVSQYYQSLLDCFKLETDWMFPGHEEPFQQHQDEIQIKFNRIERKEKRVIDAVAKGHRDTLSIAYEIYGKRLEVMANLILSEVIGYLEFAVARGNLFKTMEQGQWKFNVVQK